MKHISQLRKSIYLIVFSLLTISTAFSQNEFGDVIYPSSQEDSITNCNILKIKGWNTVIFEKDDYQDTVVAIAAVRNGRFIDFRSREEIKNNAYPHIFGTTNTKEKIQGEKYYQLKYHQAQNQKRGGAILSIVGLLAGVSSYAIIDAKNKKNQPIKTIYTITFFGGGLLFNLGTPIWISGAIKAKKSEEAMIKQQQNKLSLNWGATDNGVGMVLKF